MASPSAERVEAQAEGTQDKPLPPAQENPIAKQGGAVSITEFKLASGQRLPVTDVGAALAGRWLEVRIDSWQVDIGGSRVMSLSDSGYLQGVPRTDLLYNALLRPLEQARRAEGDGSAGVVVVADERAAFETVHTLQRSARKTGWATVVLAAATSASAPTTLSFPLHGEGRLGDPPDAEERDAPRVVVTETGYALYRRGWRKGDKPETIPTADAQAWMCEPARWDQAVLQARADKLLRPKSGSTRASVWADGPVPIGAVVDAIGILRSLDCDDTGSGCRFTDVVVQRPPPRTREEQLQDSPVLAAQPDVFGRPRERCPKPDPAETP